MRELLTAVVLCGAFVASAHAQVPGMPALTKPVNAPQEVSAGAAAPLATANTVVTTNGNALSLGGKKPLPAPAKPKAGSGVTQQMVDRSAKPAPVPARLAAAAMEQPVEMPGAPLDAAVDLANDVTYQRSQLAPGRAAINELSLRPGRNEMIQVARNQLNRLVTPFLHPAVKTTSSSTTSKVEGAIVYIATSSMDPVSIFIVDEDNPVNAISLTLMPREVPAVSMTLRLDEYVAPPAMAAAGGEMRGGNNDEFVGMLRETFRAIAMGEIPSGFGMKRLTGYSPNMPECLLPGLQAAPAQEIANGSIVVVVSKVTNRTRIPQSVDEANCASDNVLAVAAWPNVELMPGQSTELYVAVRRQAPASSNARPSVL